MEMVYSISFLLKLDILWLLIPFDQLLLFLIFRHTVSTFDHDLENVWCSDFQTYFGKKSMMYKLLKHLVKAKKKKKSWTISTWIKTTVKWCCSSSYLLQMFSLFLPTTNAFKVTPLLTWKLHALPHPVTQIQRILSLVHLENAMSLILKFLFISEIFKVLLLSNSFLCHLFHTKLQTFFLIL